MTKATRISGLVLLSAAVVAACQDFATLEVDYCKKTLRCECDSTRCCQAAAEPCIAGSCCAGLTCGPKGICEPASQLVTLTPEAIVFTDDPSGSAVKQGRVSITNVSSIHLPPLELNLGAASDAGRIAAYSAAPHCGRLAPRESCVVDLQSESSPGDTSGVAPLVVAGSQVEVGRLAVRSTIGFPITVRLVNPKGSTVQVWTSTCRVAQCDVWLPWSQPDQTFFAQPASGSQFVGWSGYAPCETQPPSLSCTVRGVRPGLTLTAQFQ